MGILHRVLARNAPAVWEMETRLMGRIGLVRAPVAVQWIVTSACDLHCPHCYSSAGRRAQGELTTTEAETRLLDELVTLGRPMLVLAGGELLLRKDIPHLIECAAQRGIPWAMHTHGGLVPRHRDTFRRYPPTMAAISLDGPEAFHDDFRGKSGSFRRALAALKVLRDAGCEDVVAGTTITRRNADLLEDLFPIVAASAATSWGLHLFAPEGRGDEHRELFPTPAQLRRVAAFGRRKRGLFHVELCNEWGGAGADDLYYRDQPFLCGAGRITCVVTSTGEVMPCTTTDVAESEGNLRERSLTEIWSEGFRRFREPGHGECSDGQECWLQARNGNPCRRQAFGSCSKVGSES